MTKRGSPQPILALTSGDPCGIGPEIILQVLAHPVSRRLRCIVIGDRAVFEQRARRVRLPLPRWAVVSPGEALTCPMAEPRVLVDCRHRGSFRARQTSARAGAASLAYLDLAMTLWKRGVVQGLVTGPVTKRSIERVRHGFVGQTEYLAAALGVPFPVMMFTARGMRLVLLSRHLPLRQVPLRVTQERIRRTAVIVAEELTKWFGIRHPRLAVCGLNPHAGEGGIYGDEERRLLLPALRALQREGIRLDGPFAADGFFAKLYGHGTNHEGQYDAILCWYHDQGLIPFKLIARDRGCQMTLGLPLVRTSPDHGSALDIAGQGCANPGSMRYALHLAAELARRARTRIPPPSQEATGSARGAPRSVIRGYPRISSAIISV